MKVSSVWRLHQYSCVTITHCDEDDNFLEYKEFRADYNGWKDMVNDCIWDLQSHIESSGYEGHSILVEVEIYGEDGTPCEEEDDCICLKIPNGFNYDSSLIHEAVLRKYQVKDIS